jgi:hypothetical protein
MMDQAERELFAVSLRQVVESAGGSGDGAALDRALDDLGWSDALEADAPTAIGALFEIQGEHCASSSALEAVVLDALGIGVDDDTGLLLPALGHADPPARVDGPTTVVRGIGLSSLAARSRAVVVVADGAGAPSAVVVETAALRPRPVGGLDPALGLAEVSVELDSLDGDSMAVTGSWTEAMAAGQRAVSHEMIGAMRTMLRLAREHALDRIQFDRPISSFQAVRHRLAESLVAIEGAAAAIDAAWEDGTPFTAASAKAVAGQNARTVRRHCQQVLAGIGFTTEHDLHLFVRRTLVLDALLGDSRSLTKQIGAELLAARGLPTLLPL